MSSRLRQPTERELRDLAMTLAGEIDLSRSPISSPDTRVEAANILATVVNRFSTDEPHRFGRSQVRQYDGYSDVVRNAGQYNAWMGQHIGTTQRNYDANRSYWDSAVKDFFSGDLVPSAPNATHYHATQVSPDWSHRLDRVGQSGPHIFYNDEAFMGRPLGERRPSYLAASPEITEPRRGQPDPARDLNAQELASIAPHTPASPQSLLAAKAPNVPQPTIRPNNLAQVPQVSTPQQQRTLGGYIAQEMGVPLERVVQGMMAPGASDRAIRGAAGLTPETQQRLANVADMLPPENQPQITSTIRNDRFRTHNFGGAVDLRNRDRTPFQEAQQVAALAREGFEAIGPYSDGRFPAHIHVGDNPIYNRPGSRFQSASRTDNPFLSGTQPNSGLYDAVDAGSPVSDAWFGPTAPTPSSAAVARNPGDGSLNAIPGITPRQDPRATDFGPMATSSFPSRPSSPASLPSARRQMAETTPRPSENLPQRPQSQQINAPEFQTASLGPMPEPQFRVSPQGSYGTPAPRRSPTDFQFASAPRTPTPPQSSFPSRPSAPSGLPASPAIPTPSVPNPMARPSMPQFAGVPNPMARPTNIGPIAGPVAAPRPRARARSVPNPVAARNQSRPGLFDGLFEALGANNWGQSFVNAPRQVVRAMTPNFSGVVQGSNLPSSNTANWQDNTGLPTYASVTRRSGGTGASAHDAWADSLGSSFY